MAEVSAVCSLGLLHMHMLQLWLNVQKTPLMSTAVDFISSGLLHYTLSIRVVIY